MLFSKPDSEIRKSLSNLNSFRYEEKFCDLELKLPNNDTFPVHRAVLSATTLFFEHKINQQNSLKNSGDSSASQTSRLTLQLPELSSCAKGFDDFLTYLYTGSVEISEENAIALMILSNHIKDSVLHEATLDFLGENLKPKNVFSRLMFALNEEKINLLSKCRLYFVTYPLRSLSIFNEPEFKSLTLEMFQKLLTDLSQTLLFPDNSFKLILEWVRNDPTERSQHLKRLLGLIAVNKIARSYLRDILGCEKLVRKSQEVCLKLVEIFEKKPRNIVYVLDCERSDLVTRFTTFKKWRFIKPFKNIFQKFIFTVYEQNIYILGQTAQDSDVLDLKEYNTQTGQWRHLGSKRESSLTSFTMCASSGKLYLSCTKTNRYDGTLEMRNTFQSFNMNEKTGSGQANWKPLSALEVPRNGMKLVECEGNVYAIAGKEVYDKTSIVEKYDHDTGSWEFVAQCRNRYESLSVAVLNGRIFVMDGSTFEAYLPREDTWIQLPYPSIFIGVDRVFLSVIDERLFAIGGTYWTTLLTFDPTTLSWLAYPGMRLTEPTFEIANVSL